MKKDKIRETLAFENLTEEEKSSRHILGRLYGPIADIINPTRNGRKYSEELWENVFDSPIMKEKFANKVLYGELGHPADREEIDMEKVAVCMPEPPKKDKDGHLIAYFDILDTPNGRLLKTLCDYGSTLGISSRGTGDLYTDDNGDEAVDPNTYDCECFDIVLVPAVESARLTFTEGLDKQAHNLKRALCEDLNKASDEDKKIMEETLDNLNIKLDEDKEIDAVEVEDKVEEPDTLVVEEPAEEEPKELTYEDKIKQLFALTYKGEESPTDEEVEAFVQAFISIFPEECYSPEGCADIIDSEEDKTSVEDEEAIDDGTELELVDSLKEALKDKTNLLAKIKSLQEQIAVSDAKVMSLQENLTKNESTIVRLTKLAKDSRTLSGQVSSLTESIKERDNTIKTLNEKLSKEDTSKEKDSIIKDLNESLSTLKESHAKEIEDLKESNSKQLNETTKLVESLKTKVTNTTKIAESYKNLADKTISKYISLRAKNLAVKPSEIIDRLPADYDVEDVDRICESLLGYNYQASKLPFDVNHKKVNIKIQESRGRHANVDVNDDDYVDESMLRLVDSL